MGNLKQGQRENVGAGVSARLGILGCSGAMMGEWRALPLNID